MSLERGRGRRRGQRAGGLGATVWAAVLAHGCYRQLLSKQDTWEPTWESQHQGSDQIQPTGNQKHQYGNNWSERCPEVSYIVKWTHQSCIFFPHFCPRATASQRWCFLILVQTSLRWLLVESGTKWRGAAIVCATGLAPRAKGESSNCLKMQAFTPTRHCRQTKENKPHRRQIHRPNSEILSFFNSIGLPLHCNRFYCKDIKLQRGLSTRVLL